MPTNFAGNYAPNFTPTGAATNPLLSDREAAALIGCGRSTVWRWVDQGILPKPLKIGGMSRWRQSDIETVIARADEARTAE